MTLVQDIDIDDDLLEERPQRSRRTGGADAQRATRSRAAQRAIDRRRKRLDRDERAGRVAERASATARPAGPRVSMRARIAGVPFVVPILALLVVGLGLSLWLSTKAAADSYRLGEARQENQSLVDRRDSLKRSYESGDSAPELSDKASRLGMIPAKNPARMIVDGTGKPRVVGDPEPAEGKAMRSINPPTGPDPVSTIDPKKVDDSQGLPGDAANTDAANGAGTQQESQPGTTTAPTTPGAAPTSPAPQGATPATPTPAAPTPSAPGAPAPDAATPGAPVPDVVAPAPNVLPSNVNAPGANSPESR